MKRNGFTLAIVILIFIGVLHITVMQTSYPRYNKEVLAQSQLEDMYRVRLRTSRRILLNNKEKTPWLFVITPTSVSIKQEPEILRLGHTLSLSRNLHWLVVEEDPSEVLFQYQIIAKHKKTKRSDNNQDSRHHSSQAPSKSESHKQKRAKRKGSRSETVSNKIQKRPIESLVVNHSSQLMPSKLIDSLEYVSLPYTLIKVISNDYNALLGYHVGLEWVKSNAPAGSVVMFLEQSTVMDYRVLDLIRNTTKVSSWPMGLLDASDSVTNPRLWLHLPTAGHNKISVDGDKVAEAGLLSCTELPPVELQTLAVATDHMRESGAELQPSVECPEKMFMQLLLLNASLTVYESTYNPRQVLSWKTKTVIRYPKLILDITKKRHLGSNLEQLQSHLLLYLFRSRS